jgi:Flp pilus assembly protein TadG
MLLKKPSAAQRSGATVVEFAAVVSIFCMFLFGMLEYTLFLYTYDVMQNAAREGARYAVVDSEDANLVTDVQTYVETLMMGLDKSNTNYSCTVYLANSSGVSINTSNPVANATTAQFGQFIAVKVSLTYKPLTPAFFLPSSAFNVQTICYMSSEAN